MFERLPSRHPRPTLPVTVSVHRASVHDTSVSASRTPLLEWWTTNKRRRLTLLGFVAGALCVTGLTFTLGVPPDTTTVAPASSPAGQEALAESSVDASAPNSVRSGGSPSDPRAFAVAAALRGDFGDGARSWTDIVADVSSRNGDVALISLTGRNLDQPAGLEALLVRDDGGWHIREFYSDIAEGA